MEGCSRQREQPVQSPAGFRRTPGKLPSGAQWVSCGEAGERKGVVESAVEESSVAGKASQESSFGNAKLRCLLCRPK